jgi:hypothetical protein
LVFATITDRIIFMATTIDPLVVEHTGTLAEFEAEMEELRRRAAGEGEWNAAAWAALTGPVLSRF